MNEQLSSFVDQVQKFSVRRNDIAHGRVFNLGEHGFYLGPNNTNPKKFQPSTGAAKYQWVAADINHYGTCFGELIMRCKEIRQLISTEQTDISDSSLGA